MIETKAQVLPLGRFKFIANTDSGFDVGDFVVLDRYDGAFLGLITDARLEYSVGETEVPTFRMGSSKDAPDRRIGSFGVVPGEGTVLGKLRDQEQGLELGFDREQVEGEFHHFYKARPDQVVCYFRVADAAATARVPFAVGRLLRGDAAVDVKLYAAGFNRPTGLFGQSGSGKSFALGSIVEGFMHNTQLDIVVLDPNGDFLRIGDPLLPRTTIVEKSKREVVSEVEYSAVAGRHEQVRKQTSVLSNDDAAGRQRIAVLPCEIEVGDLATILGLHPASDLAAYRALAEELADSKRRPDNTFAHMKNRLACGESGVDLLLDNVELSGLRVWSQRQEDTSLSRLLTKNTPPRVLVIDLSSCNRVERAIVASVVCRTLWQRQQNRKREGTREATLLVVDEAHVLFPSRPQLPSDEITLRWGTTIAGEGRKYGLYLILASQLPSKIHEQVITQCGNLVLMRMVSEGEVRSLQSSLSFASESFLQLSRWFKTGEALVMGGISPAPLLVRFDRRLTPEGGGDMDVDWRPR